MSDGQEHDGRAQGDAKASAATTEEGETTGTSETSARETGDITGATSTHAGAGGVMENTGGTGTAPTGDVP
jgi:hypothetical protein